MCLLYKCSPIFPTAYNLHTQLVHMAVAGFKKKSQNVNNVFSFLEGCSFLNSFILAIFMLHITYLFNSQEVRLNSNILDSMLFRMQLGPPEVGLKTSELNTAITYTALYGLLSYPRYWHQPSKKLYC